MLEHHNHNAAADDPSADEEITLDTLDRDRQLSRLRLKSTFEDIFAKYECDFSNVGDEIDLETEEVIVDNGHLSGMLDEQDVGRVVADQCLRCLAPGSLGEEEVGEGAEEGEEKEEEEEEEEEETAVVEGKEVLVDGISIDFGHPVAGASRHWPNQRKQVSNSVAKGTNIERRAVPFNTMQNPYASQMSVSEHLSSQVPGNESQNNASNFESAALQALSTSIARQITQFLSSMRQSMAPQKQSVWGNVPPLPRKEIRAFQPPQRQISGIDRHPSSSLKKRSLWAVHSIPRKRKRHSLGSHSSGEHLAPKGQTERRSSSRIATSEVKNTPRAALSKSSPTPATCSAQKDRVSLPGRNDTSYSANTKRLMQPKKWLKSRLNLSTEDDELIYDMRCNRKESWDNIVNRFPFLERESLQRRYYKVKKMKSEYSVGGDENNINEEISILQESHHPIESRYSSPQIMQPPQAFRTPDPSISISVEIDNTKAVIPNSTSDSNDSLLNSLSHTKGSVDDTQIVDDKKAENSQETSAQSHTNRLTPKSPVERPIWSNSKDHHTPSSRRRFKKVKDTSIDDELTLGPCQLPQLSSAKRRRTKQVPNIWESEDELAILEMNWS